ncbi:MAG: hypothetical protein VKJ24_03695 [Synechococcales bacterium]|nr:hypothetical protein [Synechococcales bacterium]
MLTRLANRGALLINTEQLETLTAKVELRAQRWEHRCGLLGATAMVIAFLASTGFSRIELMIVEAIAAYFGGGYLGRMASYGMLRQLLHQERLLLQAQPGHLDGASGFKPLGDFYFWQAMVAALPAMYLAIWWLIIPILPRYLWWRDSYLGLLVIAIAFELLAFTVPLWLFHLEMQQQKVQFLKEADQISRSLFEIENQLVTVETTQEREQLKEQITQFSKRYWEIEKMPTWPVDFKILRHFGLNNLALCLPLISKLAGNSEVWQNLETLIKSLK